MIQTNKQKYRLVDCVPHGRKNTAQPRDLCHRSTSLQGFHVDLHSNGSLHGVLFQVKWSVIWTFIKAGGLTSFWVLVVFQLLFITATVATSMWLSNWSNDQPQNNTSADTALRLGVYGGLGIVQGKACFYLYLICLYGVGQ